MMRDPNQMSANERLKGRFQEIAGSSLIAAVLLHLLAFTLFPEMSAAVWDDEIRDPPVIIPIEEVDYPDEPQPLQRPVAPIASVDVEATATIEPVEWDRVPDLVPPSPDPAASADGADASPFYTYEVAPRLQNPRELQRALERAYPAPLRDARVGGTVTLEVFVDAQGEPVEARVFGSSGYGALDGAALGLIDVMRFSPALNRDRRVPVWVRIPIAFEARQEERAG